MTWASHTLPLAEALERIDAGKSLAAEARPAGNGEYGVLKLSAVTWGSFRPEENKAFFPGYVPDPAITLRAGDLLISRANTTELVGAVAVVEEDYPYLALSDKTLRLVPRADRAHRRYLMHALREKGARDFIEARATGTSGSMRNISQATILGVPVPLPPLPEQKRIATILDKADAMRRKRQEAIHLTGQLLQSAFLEMFGDPVKNPKGWGVQPFGKVGVLDRGRSRHRPRNDPRLLGGPYPLIQTGEVANSDGEIRTSIQTYSELGLAQSRMWPADTLCITIAANIAKTAVLTFDACFPDSVVGFAPGDAVTTEFVQQWLRFLQPLLEAQAPQSAQKNINLRILRDLEMPVPPLNLQRCYSMVVARVRRATRRHSEGALDLTHLASTLTARAFSGRL